jgi:hypothetical protein
VGKDMGTRPFPRWLPITCPNARCLSPSSSVTETQRSSEWRWTGCGLSHQCCESFWGVTVLGCQSPGSILSVPRWPVVFGPSLRASVSQSGFTGLRPLGDTWPALPLMFVMSWGQLCLTLGAWTPSNLVAASVPVLGMSLRTPNFSWPQKRLTQRGQGSRAVVPPSHTPWGSGR